MQITRTVIISFILSIVLSACVTLPSNMKEPGVSVISVAPRLVNSLTPQFDIVLRVTNPNRDTLSMIGLSYDIYLEGNKVIDGVAGDLPDIAPYGEAEIDIKASASLIGSFNLIQSLANSPGEDIDFEFKAEIDIGKWYPTIKVSKTGVIAF